MLLWQQFTLGKSIMQLLGKLDAFLNWTSGHIHSHFIPFWFCKLRRIQGLILIAEPPLHVVKLSLCLKGQFFQTRT